MNDDLPAQTPLTFTASANELAVILELMERGPFSTWASLLHVALGRLAIQLDIDVPKGAFELRSLKRDQSQ